MSSVSFYKLSVEQNTGRITDELVRGLSDMGMIVPGREELARQQLTAAVSPTVKLIHDSRGLAISALKGGKGTPGRHIMDALRKSFLPSSLTVRSPAVAGTTQLQEIVMTLTERIAVGVLSSVDSETGATVRQRAEDETAYVVATSSIFDRLDALLLAAEGTSCVIDFVSSREGARTYVQIAERGEETQITRGQYELIQREFTVDSAVRVLSRGIDAFYDELRETPGVRADALSPSPRMSSPGDFSGGDYFVTTQSGNVYCLGARVSRVPGRSYAQLHDIGISARDFAEMIRQEGISDIVADDVDTDGPQDLLDEELAGFAAERSSRVASSRERTRGSLMLVTPGVVRLKGSDRDLPRKNISGIAIEDERIALFPGSAMSVSATDTSKGPFRIGIELIMSEAFDTSSFAVESLGLSVALQGDDEE